MRFKVPPRRTAARWLAGVGVSSLLHGILLLSLATHVPSDSVPVRSQPLAFTLVEPSPSPASQRSLSTESQSRAQRPKSLKTTRPRYELSDRPPTGSSETQEPAATRPRSTRTPSSDLGPGPRRGSSGDAAPDVDFYAPEAIANAARNRRPPEKEDPELEGHALAQARLKHWDQSTVEALKPQVRPDTPGLDALRLRLTQHFTPDNAVVVRDGVPPSGRQGMQSEAQRQMESFNKGSDGRTSGLATLFCFGACGGSHHVGSLWTWIDVDHDASGRPESWRVFRSSGSQPFDRAALDAIESAAVALAAHLDKPPVRWSRWALGAETFRWSRDELMLDPGFIPPGREVESQSGWAGTFRLVRQVKLINAAMTPL